MPLFSHMQKAVFLTTRLNLKPHFYTVELGPGSTGVFIIFLFAHNIDCGYSKRCFYMCFRQKYEKHNQFSSEEMKID